MSAGWEIGDLALCVDVSDRTYPEYRVRATAGRRLEHGRVYRVANIAAHRITGETVLFMEGESDTAGAWRFRKIKPDAHQGEREDWNLLLESLKPVRVESPNA